MNVEPWATELDELLAEWRSVRQLDPQTVEQIYQTIITTAEAAMSEEWWRQYERYLVAVIQQAKEFSSKAPFNFAYQARVAPKRTIGGAGAITPVQWQPYLKLA